jgi:hypothetical protein
MLHFGKLDQHIPKESIDAVQAAAMKKATNSLALRAGGFEVFPIAKIFDLPSNVWYPSILIRENLLAEPFAAWAANVFYTRRCCLYRRVAFQQQTPARGFILSF